MFIRPNRELKTAAEDIMKQTVAATWIQTGGTGDGSLPALTEES
jgi:hypothetical protein